VIVRRFRGKSLVLGYWEGLCGRKAGKSIKEVMRRKITGGSDAALQEAKRSQSAAQASLCLGRGQSHFVRPVPLCGERAAWPEDAAR